MKKVLLCVMATVFCLTLGVSKVQAAPAAAPTYSEASATDWDSVLNDYEKFVDKYIAVYKKVQAGDMSAYSDMASLLDKANKLQAKLEKASDELTSAQAARFAKIAKKLANAM